MQGTSWRCLTISGGAKVPGKKFRRTRLDPARDGSVTALRFYRANVMFDGLQLSCTAACIIDGALS